MFRPAFCTLLIAGSIVASANAQPPPIHVESLSTRPLVVDPLDSKELAKAKRALAGADVRKQKQARFEAARTEFDGGFREFLVGRGTLDVLYGSIRQLMKAERSIGGREADRTGTLEGYWLPLWQIERITKARMEAGRISTKEYYGALFERLGAESPLMRVGTWQGHQTRSALFGTTNSAVSEYEGHQLFSKALAQAKFKAYQTDPMERTRTRIRAAQIVVYAREMNFLAGRGTLDILLEWLGLLRDAGLALSSSEADRIRHLDDYWAMTWLNEEVNKAQHEAGRIPIQDYLSSQFYRLGAQIALSRAWSAQKEKGETRSHPVGGLRFVTEEFGFPDEKRLAQAKFAAVLSDPGELAQARLAAVRGEYREREKEFQNGRGTLDILLECAGNLLLMERELARTEAGRTIALERHWARMKLITDVNQDRFDKGRIPIQDLAQSRYFLLNAEIALVQARDKTARP